METKLEIINGYFLILKESGGRYEDAWSINVRSWFIEKNSETEKAIKRICEEFQFFGVEFKELLRDYGQTFCPPDGYISNYYDERCDSLCLYLHDAVKIGDEIFKKVSLIKKEQDPL